MAWQRPLLAGAVNDAIDLRETLESVILYALSKPFRNTLEFKRFDYYDNSIEFWSYPGIDLDATDVEVLWVLGFDRCWVCYQERGSDDGEKPTGEEKYYSKPGAPAR